jgi:hypothetical protein
MLLQLAASPLNCHVIAVLLIDMPLAFSSSIQSLVADLLLARALTSPASWMAPPYSSSFSVMVVLPDKPGCVGGGGGQHGGEQLERGGGCTCTRHLQASCPPPSHQCWPP